MCVFYECTHTYIMSYMHYIIQGLHTKSSWGSAGASQPTGKNKEARLAGVPTLEMFMSR